jgi:hypothetical protein
MIEQKVEEVVEHVRAQPSTAPWFSHFEGTQSERFSEGNSRLTIFEELKIRLATELN